MKILAIETSCDETAIALVEARSTGSGWASGGLMAPKFKILKSVVTSQIKIHRPFGGVVPNLAKREHLKNLPVLLGKIFDKSPFDTTQDRQIANHFRKIDLIAVTVGPGLEPALWTGITFAQELAKRYKKPLLGVSHLEGHLYSFLLPQDSKSPFDTTQDRQIANRRINIFPAVALIVSGGHTILLKVENLAKWKKLGETRDDAVGEAFDKVARLLKLPYPGGPEIEKLSKKGSPTAVNFPRPMIYEKNYDFSFSGLKTSVLYYVRDNKKTKNEDVAASFQQAAVEVLTRKTMRAAKEFKVKSVLLSGGVATNQALRKNLERATRTEEINFLAADRKYNTDNAVMIAAAGYMDFLRKKKYPLKADGNLGI